MAASVTVSMVGSRSNRSWIAVEDRGEVGEAVGF
jgi:hypothetical protein